jgi:hypothetical protein
LKDVQIQGIAKPYSKKKKGLKNHGQQDSNLRKSF